MIGLRRGRWTTLSDVPVTVTSADIITGTDNVFVTDNTIRGILNSNTPGSSSADNATIINPAPVDQVVVRHSDVTSWTAGQIIGIYDLLWCLVRSEISSFVCRPTYGPRPDKRLDRVRLGRCGDREE